MCERTADDVGGFFLDVAPIRDEATSYIAFHAEQRVMTNAHIDLTKHVDE
jgi:hypothetical protein